MHKEENRMAEPNLEPRVTALETSITSLTEDVRSLGRSLERYADSTTTQITELSSKFSASQKTPWGVLASWAGVVLVIVGMAGSSFIKDILDIEDRVGVIEKNYLEHVMTQGHPALIARVDSIERDILRGDASSKERHLEQAEAIKNLDIVLQREMRLLDETTQAELLALDQRLQLEMALLDSIVEERVNGHTNVLKERLEAAKEELEKVREEQSRRTSRIYETQ